MTELIIIVNTILPFLGVVQACRTISTSIILQEKLKANKMKLEEQGLIYLLSEDKEVLMLVARIVITLIAIANAILLTWSISRIVQDFAPYATNTITYTAVLFHLVAFLIAHFIFLIYSRSGFKIIKWLNNKIKYL